MEPVRQERAAAARIHDPLHEARRVLDIEIAGLRAVQLLYDCTGRVVVTGLGKSGIVAKKIAATLTSTGTPSLYLHPVEAAHGDMGILAAEDVLLVVSYSGANDELDEVLAACQRLRIPIVALTGSPNSLLAQRSDLVVDCRVPEEACPLGLAPTASTTAALAVGDALAVALLQRRDFRPEQFAQMHPSGVLGRRLLLTVGDIMRRGNDLPVVDRRSLLVEALPVMMEKRLGCLFVTDGAGGRLLGILTDGDLKRLLVREGDPMRRPLEELMVRDPKRVEARALVVQALRQMEENPGGAITQLVVVDDAGRLTGAVHMHDIVKLGLASAPPA
jgi:arabinose-5-phosphate isomerase